MANDTGTGPAIHESASEAAHTWGKNPAGWTHAQEFEPGTQAFFERARELRATTEIHTLLAEIPFASSRDRDVVEAGFGAGYDAMAFLEAGARYTGVDITPENLVRATAHLGFYGFAPPLLTADARRTGLADASFDIYFSNGVLHHVADMQACLNEATRLLRPGGEAWIVVYYKYSIFYLFSKILIEHLIGGKFRHQSMAVTRSGIETTGAANSRPHVDVYSAREMQTKLKAAGLEPSGHCIRKLNIEDFPASGRLGFIWRRIPGGLWRLLERRMGWYLFLRARKPA